MTIVRASSGFFIVAAALALMGLSACGPPPPISAADHAFDEAFSMALAEGAPFAVSSIEPEDWTMVCAVGEGRPADMLRGHAARPGETAFESLFDAAAYWSGPSSALAFLYPDGVEVRPVNGLHVNMGQPINRCVERAQAVLVPNGDDGWRFQDFAAESEDPPARSGGSIAEPPTGLR